MTPNRAEILERALAREKAARKAAEKILEQKAAELYSANKKLEKSYLELEALLDKTDSQLQGVFENIVDAYVIMDLMGNILKMNDAAVNLLGFDTQNVNANLLDFPIAEEQEKVSQSFKTLLKDGAVTDFIIKINTKKNVIKLVHINASIIYDQGIPVAAQGIVRDVTEERRTAELIEAQKKELDAIVQNSSLGIVLAQDQKIIRTNEAFQRLLGFSEEELLKKTINEIADNSDVEQVKQYIGKMASGDIDNFVLHRRYIRKNGSVFWAKTSVAAVRNSDGSVKYRLGLVEDVTSERERSLILGMVNEITNAILGKIDIYEIANVITSRIAEYLNTDYCIIYLVNKYGDYIEPIAGYGVDADSREKNIENAKFPIEHGVVKTVVQTGKPILTKDASSNSKYVFSGKQLNSKITVPISNDGKVIGVIDARHAAKNYFSNKQLQTIERIASLVAMQLKSAINLREKQRIESKNEELLEKLAKSNNELQEYAHIVSHDLKSPLRSINALVTWLKEDNVDKLDNVSLQNIALIETTLEKMDQLISDVLEYSSIGSDDDELTEVNLDTLIADLIQIMYKPEHIKVEILNKLPTIKGDKTKLQQVFQNLISNAIKFIDKPEGYVKVSVEDISTHYKFSIKDNGIGIDEKYHSKIFKVFQSVNKRKDSSGIGLSIVKKVVELHEGKIWLTSKLNEGTTFFFTLKK
ncbi:PAS domain S-box protein [Seonamhaeicola algicola]|uniref:histidine kinase n=1 Tax=Seonamhaeicola algicola TaxID=1719036 RepID=A0A5C7B2M6_9FLAO|nr:PAS domain S-box protein [Seonamhaeicola algicola]TXE14981.1 PAS domain S-box protein [Seonamhaeicola algicola]